MEDEIRKGIAMKRKAVSEWAILVLMGLSPLIWGYLYNLLMTYNDPPKLVTYMLAAAFLVFWFWVGQMFAKRIKKPVAGILIGNAAIICCVVIYLWQTNFFESVAQIHELVFVSQLGVTPVISLGAKFGATITKIVQPGKYGPTQLTWNLIQFIGLALEMGFFSWGYLTKRSSLKKNP